LDTHLLVLRWIWVIQAGQPLELELQLGADAEPRRFNCDVVILHASENVVVCSEYDNWHGTDEAPKKRLKALCVDSLYKSFAFRCAL
jgi:hypothetical protein